MRVAAALLLGALVCGVGEWVWRRRMRGLAATLYGTGVAILMTSCFGANRYFEPPVLSRGVAFAGVAIAAALGIFLALRVNVMTVAILSFIGAYLSPAILSSGQDKSLELLSYLAILAAAAWVLVVHQGRPRQPGRRRGRRRGAIPLDAATLGGAHRQLCLVLRVVAGLRRAQ
jgi:uncharacterized membrane protein